MHTADDLETLGARLLALRQAKGATASQVAHEALGYDNGSHVAVTRLERGIVAMPRREHLLLLAKYFGVPAEYLLIDRLKLADAPPAQKRPVRNVEPVKTTAEVSVSRPTPRNFPERVRQVREEANLDEAEFAQALKQHGAIITTSNVLDWEAGEREPNPIQLRALSRFAQRPEQWLLDGGTSRPVEPAVAVAPWVC